MQMKLGKAEDSQIHIFIIRVLEGELLPPDFLFDAWPICEIPEATKGVLVTFKLLQDLNKKRWGLRVFF